MCSQHMQATVHTHMYAYCLFLCSILPLLQFYNTFTAYKVRMALIEVKAYTTSDPITITTDSSSTLTLWKEHFRNNIRQDVPADAALLFV